MASDKNGREDFSELNVMGLLLDMHAKQSALDVCMKEIRHDVKEHMRRTAQNEADIKWVKKHVFIAHGAISVIFLLAAIVGILYQIGVFN